MISANLLFYRVQRGRADRPEPSHRGPSSVMVLNMSELNSMIARDLSRFYRDKSEAIHALMGPLSTDQIWTRPYPYGNSMGHLLLHLTGNLNYYIGAEIAGTGYVRNRPLEFSDPVRHPQEE